MYQTRPDETENKTKVTKNEPVVNENKEVIKNELKVATMLPHYLQCCFICLNIVTLLHAMVYWLQTQLCVFYSASALLALDLNHLNRKLSLPPLFL